jgi:hypothetical protein
MRVVYNALAVSHMERGNFLEANRVFAQAMEAMSAQQEMGLVRARARCNAPRCRASLRPFTLPTLPVHPYPSVPDVSTTTPTPAQPRTRHVCAPDTHRALTAAPDDTAEFTQSELNSCGCLC